MPDMPRAICSAVTRTGPWPIATEIVSPRYHGCLRAARLHGRRGNDAALFIGKVDAGRPPEAEEPCRLGDRVDAEPLAHRVEVRVARDLKRRREVHGSVMA